MSSCESPATLESALEELEKLRAVVAESLRALIAASAEEGLDGWNTEVPLKNMISALPESRRAALFDH